MSKKLPAFQFYPGDWLKDPNLRRCTHAAKGVWVDILCLMHESQERGYLATSGVAWSDEDIALAVGGDKSIVLACITELTLKGVAKRDARGALYSKRMVSDERKRRLCSDAGKKGGNPALLAKNSPTLKGQDKGEVKGRVKPELTPSSSTSSSSLLRKHTPLPPTGGESGEFELEGDAGGLKPSRAAEAEEIYDAYPRKVAKPAAIKAITSALKEHSRDLILKATRNFAIARAGEDPSYTPHPATWFSQRRFLDDPATWSRARAVPATESERDRQRTGLEQKFNIRDL